MLSAACHHLPAFLASRCDQEPKVPPGTHRGQPPPSFPCVCEPRERLVQVWQPLTPGHLSHWPHASGL